MKEMKKVLVLLLALCLAVTSLVACGDEEEDESEAKATPVELKSGITDEQLGNYIIKYDVTKEEMITDENGNNVVDEATGTYVTESKTTHYVEVCYQGLLLKSTDGGETFAYDTSAVYCFSVVGQSDPRGLLSAYAQFSGKEDQLEKVGEEEVAGLQTTSYNYKSGLLDYTMYYNEDYKITLKYVNNGKANVTFKEMTVTELQFGVINSDPAYNFNDFAAKVATPAPAAEADAAA